MPQCIYCLEVKPPSSFNDREHVVPQSFGKFEPNNLVLRNSVCDVCNDYFSATLELALARDTIEGHQRFEYGIRPARDFRPFGKESRLNIQMGHGPLKGAKLKRVYSPSLESITVDLLPQVGFRQPRTRTRKWFLIEEVPSKAELEKLDLNLKAPDFMLIIGPGRRKSIAALRRKGYKLQNPTSVSGKHSGKITSKIGVRIDPTIQRAYAKIAFNYFVSQFGPEVALHRNFDEIRKYVRLGIQPRKRIVDVRQSPILLDEPIKGKRRRGHIIVLGKAVARGAIAGHVSLLNNITYDVSVCRKIPPRFHFHPIGHFFNLGRDRAVLPILAVNADIFGSIDLFSSQYCPWVKLEPRPFLLCFLYPRRQERLALTEVQKTPNSENLEGINQ